MAFCAQCGAEVAQGNFCPNCGATVGGGGVPQGAPQGQYQQAPQGAPQQQYQQQAYASAPFAVATPAADSIPDPMDVQNNKVGAVLAYLGILILVPVLTGAYKTSPFARFHTNQGLIFIIASVAFSIVWSIVISIISAAVMFASPVIGIVLFPILSLVYILVAVIGIMGIVNAATGKLKELPFIGKFKLIK